MGRRLGHALAVVAFCAGFLATREVSASCTVSSDCNNINSPICHLGVCVPCGANYGTGTLLDCPNASAPYCQMSGSLGGACTECGPGSTANCDMAQPVCLSNGTCGCTMTSDCSGGLVCDPGTSTCVGADAGVDGGLGSDGASGDGSGADAQGDGAAEDGQSEDGATNDGSQAGDGSVVTDGSLPDGGAPSSGDTGPLNDGVYVEGGGCTCNIAVGEETSPRTFLLSLVVSVLALRAQRRRRSPR
jgi:hypothetical protein